MKQTKTINIVVMNTQELQAGTKPVCEFNKQGGVIGSDTSALWSLQSQSTDEAVQPGHCEILLFDGHFCVRDLCGETYINGASMPLGKSKMAQLAHKDTIKVGCFNLVVLDEASDNNVSLQSQSLDLLFGQDSDLLSNDDSEIVLSEGEAENTDPMDLLGTNQTEQLRADHLLKDDFDDQAAQEKRESLLGDSQSKTNSESTFQADSEFEMSSAIKLKKRRNFNLFSYFSKSTESAELDTPNDEVTWLEKEQSGVSYHRLAESNTEENMMDDKTLDLLEEEMAMNGIENSDAIINNEQNHILSGPLFKGLGVKVTDHNQAMDIQLMSEEIGAALQAAIKGILELHQHVDKGRYDVINKNLQPIEDNPLRLGLSYDETVRTMFRTDASAVHLSAPASISESLKNLKDHNDVVQVATTVALGQIVQAFSPETLMRRFESYRRSYEIPEQNKGEWAWKMYQSYYHELTSERQQGFEKLFWEIFEQSYDRLLREKQSEAQ